MNGFGRFYIADIRAVSHGRVTCSLLKIKAVPGFGIEPRLSLEIPAQSARRIAC